MGNGNASGRAGAWLAIAVALSMLAACGEVTAGGAEVSQACAKKSCAGKKCPPPDPRKQDGDAGGACVAGPDGGTGGATGGGDGQTGAGGAGANGNVPAEVADFSCTVCRRAENCCKAEGLTDCSYTAACASARNAEQMQFYVVLCRAVLSASADGTKQPSDVCGF
jgi:hypothetical protein